MEEKNKCPFLHENINKNESSEKLKTSAEPNILLSDDENNNYVENNSNSSNNDPIQQNHKKCLFVNLKPEASYFNLSSFYLVQFSYVCFFVFMDSQQPHLLSNKDYIEGVNEDESGKINSSLVFYENLYLIVFISIFGAFHDVFGRKLVCSIGFMLIAISLFLYPISKVVFPNLLLVRLIFSNGICAVTTQPLLADYVNHNSKGFAGGIVAFLSGMGALFSVFILGDTMKKFVSLGEQYFIAAGFSLFVGIFCAFGVKNVQTPIKKSFNERM